MVVDIKDENKNAGDNGRLRSLSYDHRLLYTDSDFDDFEDFKKDKEEEEVSKGEKNGKDFHKKILNMLFAHGSSFEFLKCNFDHVTNEEVKSANNCNDKMDI